VPKIQIADHFLPLLNNQHRFLILCGGYGSGKSEFAGRKIYYRCETEGNHKFLILRKVRGMLRESCIDVMLSILEENEVSYDYNKTDRKITFYNHNLQNNEILFEGLDDPKKIKSIKGVTSAWLEELTEFTKDDFRQIDLRIRGHSKYYKQIICSFNPEEAKAPWIKIMFFDKVVENAKIDISTVDDNPFIDDEYIKQLDNIDDEVYRDIYRYGKWAIAKGLIYNNWVRCPYPAKVDEQIWGLDFGFNNPSALIRIGIKDKEYYVQEMLYRSNLTNQELIQQLKNIISNKREYIYADCAEPDRIKEIHQAGFNVFPSNKNITEGIDFLKRYKLLIEPNSHNLIDEIGGYKWKEDKFGNTVDEPVKFKDHLMDAMRYAIYSYQNKVKVGIAWL